MRARFRAWRFQHPDFGEVGNGLNLIPGLGVEMVEGDAAIRQAIYLLLSTRPGERVMRPEYGCPLHRLIFAPNDETTAGLAIFYVQRAIKRWEPRIDVLELDARRSPDRPEQLEIFLKYRIKATQQTSALVFPLNLTGEEA
ncbi:MAG: hypothetical protein BroJett038_01100 [Chloroflexota bacterium]|jgi:hypothetical protein|nr:MAG: hypothetical protein BroJett038_01100 [Chloroflexota bacterium]